MNANPVVKGKDDDDDDDDDDGRKPDTPQVSDDEDEDDDRLLIDEGPGSAKPVSIDTVPDVTQVVVVPHSNLTIIGPPTLTAYRFGYDVQLHRLKSPISPSEVIINQKTLLKLQNFDRAIQQSSRFKGAICWNGLFKLCVDTEFFGIISLDGFSDIPIPRSGVRLLSYLTKCPNIIWTVIDPTGTRFYGGLDYIGTFLKRHLLDNGRVSTSVVNFGIQSTAATVAPPPLNVGTVTITATTTTTTSTTTTSTSRPTTSGTTSNDTTALPTTSTAESTTSTNVTPTVAPAESSAVKTEPVRVVVALESLPTGFPPRITVTPKPPPFDWSKAAHEVLSCSDRRLQFRRNSEERLFPRLVRDFQGRCDNVQLQRRRELEVQRACGHRPYRYYLVWRKLTDVEKSSFRTLAQEMIRIEIFRNSA